MAVVRVFVLTLEVTGEEMASLEGITSEDPVVLLAGAPGGAEATLGQRGAEALAGLEGAGHMLGGMSVDPWCRLAESEGGLPGWPNRKKRRPQAEPSSGCRATSARSRSWPPLARRRAPVPTLKSTVIPLFPTKPLHPVNNNNSTTLSRFPRAGAHCHSGLIVGSEGKAQARAFIGVLLEGIDEAG